MSEIEQKENYQVAVVVIAYGFYGGIIGGVIVALYILVESFFVENFLTIAPLMLLSVLAGAIYGFLPAILTGIWLAFIKFTVTKKVDYFIVAVIGFFSTVFYLVTYAAIKSFDTNYPILGIGLVGALSAMILGWLVLPKQRESGEKENE